MSLLTLSRASLAFNSACGFYHESFRSSEEKRPALQGGISRFQAHQKSNWLAAKLEGGYRLAPFLSPKRM